MPVSTAGPDGLMNEPSEPEVAALTPDLPTAEVEPPHLAYRAVKNSFWGMISFGWPILIALVAQPFMVHRLGQDLYGVLTVVGISLGFFGVLDFGIGGAATRQIATYHAKNEPDQVNRVVSTILAFYLVVGAIVGTVIVLLSSSFATHWLKIPADLQNVARIAFLLAGPSFLITMLNGAFGSIPSALQRYDISTKVGIVLSFVGNGAALGLLALGRGLVEIQISGLVIGVLAMPVYFLVAKRLLPTLAIRPHWDYAMFRELFSFGGYFLISTIGVTVLYQLDKLLVGNLLGVAAVTLYTVPSGLARQVQGLTSAATGVVFPMSAALLETDQRERLATLYLEGSRMVYILITMVAVPLAVFGDKFLLYWMGPEIAAGSSVAMVLLVVTYYILSFTAIPWQIANGSGWAKINAFYTLAMAATDIGLFFVLVPHFGVPGAAAAYLIAAAVGVPVLIATIERKVLGMSGSRFLTVYWRVGLVGVIQLGMAVLLRPLCGRLLTTVAVMAVSALSFVVLYSVLGFVQDSDKRLLKALSSRFKR